MTRLLALSALGTASAFLHGRPAARASTTKLNSKWGPDWELKPESLCIHGGWAPDPTTTARAVPVYRTAPYQFESTEKAAKLFALAELGNIYSRLMNPTVDGERERERETRDESEPPPLARARACARARATPPPRTRSPRRRALSPRPLSPFSPLSRSPLFPPRRAPRVLVRSAREAHGAARGRARARRARRRVGHERGVLRDHQPRADGRQHRVRAEPVRRRRRALRAVSLSRGDDDAHARALFSRGSGTAARTRSSTTSCRASASRSSLSTRTTRRRSRRRRTRRRAASSRRRARTPRSTSPT